MSNKKIIVTGGAGFIGSNLVSALLKKENKIYVFDNFSTGKDFNLDNKNPNLRIYNQELTHNFKLWPQIEADEIYHFAANADVRGGQYNREIDFEQNLKVTKSICDYAVLNGIKKVVFASSATVYGEPLIFPTPEKNKSRQTSIYGASKLAAESFIEAYSEYGDFKSYIFRFVSWTGPRYSHGVIYDFVKKLKKDPYNLEILGDGRQTKSYLDVDDGVEGVIKLSNIDIDKSIVYNLGHDDKINVIDLANIVIKEMGLANVNFTFAGGSRGWVGDSPLVHLDTNLAKSHGWRANISLENTIKRTVNYLLKDEKRLFR